MDKIFTQIAAELNVRPRQVESAVGLLDAGSTVPFIARYRKEATEGLDDIQLRALQTRLAYLRELQERRVVVLQSMDEQGKLTPGLRNLVEAVVTKQELEDLYLPFKPKRRTKAMVAKEAGLEPLADLLFTDPQKDPSVHALGFVRADAGFVDVSSVLDGVRDIFAERWSEDAELVKQLREWLWSEGFFASRLVVGKDAKSPEISKFLDYFDYSEPICKVPSHRALAAFRGRSQEVLALELVVPQGPQGTSACLAQGRMTAHLQWSHLGRPADDFIRKCIAWTWKVKLTLSLERDLFSRLHEKAEVVATKVFAENLRDLLLAAPAGPKVVMGLDPGLRTGCKVAVVDATGKVLDTATIYPHQPRNDWQGALHTLSGLCSAHGVYLIAIGNGTASRETDKLASELIQRLPNQGVKKVVVSEAGASVYSASEYASLELPELDVTLRGAVSIARRLQDPLSELVKIDPQSIGVGQYQHDVNQIAMARCLDTVVEDCVNTVGVDLNTASVPLLSRVSGLSRAVASSIVRWRDTHGAFQSRQQLLEVSGLGPKTFEQSAGFLRIRDASNPLDGSGVHPETYPVVQKIAQTLHRPLSEVIGNSQILRSLHPEAYADSFFGAGTVKDILVELEKPGRDPRPDFKVARMTEGVEDLKDLQVGMTLEGTVSNVAQFGAFVDLGVHQDGLVHVSQLSDKFVNDAREIVKTGDIVKVKVLEIDLVRRRVSLTMKLGTPVSDSQDARTKTQGAVERSHKGVSKELQPEKPVVPSAMAAAFAKLQSLKAPST